MIAIDYLFFDLDGTLLNESKKISRKTICSLKSIKKRRNISIGIATGRTLRFVLNLLEKSVLLETVDVVVANNGVEIYEVKSKTLRTLPKIQPETINNIVKTFKQEEYLNIAFHNARGLFAIKKDSTVEQILRDNSINKCYSPLVDIYEETPRVILLFNAKDKKKVMQKVENWPLSGVKGLFSMNDTYEFMDENVSKAKGIQYYLEGKNHTLMNVLAFGDSENDDEMIRLSGMGVAMQNATTEIKEVASFVCENTNDDDGIHFFLERYENYIWGIK